MATVRPRKVYLQNRQHAVVLHCWELPGHQSGQFIHGHFCRRKLHVDAPQLQRGRLMEHSEAQFKALNVLRANLPWGQSALSGTTHRAGLAGEWSSWAQNMGQVHRKAFHLCFSVWASKTWSSSVRISFSATGSIVIFTVPAAICWESIPKGLQCFSRGNSAHWTAVWHCSDTSGS